MSASTLPGRIESCAKLLRDVETHLAGAPGQIPETATAIRQLATSRDVKRWSATLDARGNAVDILDKLVDRTDPTKDVVEFGGVLMPFRIARHLAVQAYLSTTWALADCVSAFAGRILCDKGVAQNAIQPPKLVANLVCEGRGASCLLWTACRESFGWPIGLSYAIRNHFAHDDGHRDATEFFEGTSVAAGFRVSKPGWEYVQTLALKYKVAPTHMRASEPWPWNPDDLREVLRICHRELDEALGVVLGSACSLLHAQVSLLLGIV